jgi:hypothetical protein
MRFFFSFRFRHLMLFPILVFGAVLLMPNFVAAQSRDDEHVVSAADLRKEIQNKVETRKELQAKVEKFFSSKQAKQAFKNINVEPQAVRNAVRQLDDNELARLAAQTDKVQSEFAAGALTNQEITYILIALGTAVLILVLVVA